MSEDMMQNVSARKRRVKRLKRLIVLTLLTLIILPFICSIVLLVQVYHLNRRVDELTGQLAGLEELIRREVAEEEPEEFLSEISVSIGQGAAPDADAPPQPSELDSMTEDGTESDDAVPEQEVVLPESDADASVRRVYLTFDDGPSSNTDEILDILKEYDVKATFFVVGKEDENSKKAIKRIVEEGHTLGMHSYSHKYSQLYVSKENFAADLEKLHGYLYDLTGMDSHVYRFPGGSSNTVSAVSIQELADYLDGLGIVFYDWNVASGDGGRTLLGVDTLIKNCTKDLGKWDTTIILMHDSADKPTTVKALPAVIEKILAMEDTEILPITEDTVPIQHIHRNK